MYIIAEIGVNHNGDVELAKKLVQSAFEIGCDAVKFQTFNAERLASRSTPLVPYQLRSSSLDGSHFEMLKRLELSQSEHEALFTFCHQLGIEFISTPYDAKSVEFLAELGVTKIKTASADIIDYTIHESICAHELEPIVSVGMATIEEVDRVVKIYRKRSITPTLLHCVSNYPCSLSSLNLSVIQTLRDKFECPVGYSDHSVGSDAAFLSVPFGVKIIEKHFTLDKSWPGPDHAASSTPEELKELIMRVQLAELICGNGHKMIQPEEADMRLVSRKSVFASKKILKGQALSRNNTILLRPGTGIPADKYEEVMGATANVDIEPYQMIDISVLSPKTGRN